MPNITDLIPEDAITVADTAEYTAWKSQDGSEVFIDMKEPNAFVTESILMEVVQRVYEEGGSPKKVTVPDGEEIYKSVAPNVKPLKEADAIDVYDTDFGTFDLIDLKRQEAEVIEEARKALLEKHPELEDVHVAWRAFQDMSKLLVENGFTEEQVKSINDASVISVIYEFMKLKQSMTDITDSEYRNLICANLFQTRLDEDHEPMRMECEEFIRQYPDEELSPVLAEYVRLRENVRTERQKLSVSEDDPALFIKTAEFGKALQSKGEFYERTLRPTIKKFNEVRKAQRQMSHEEEQYSFYLGIIR